MTSASGRLLQPRRRHRWTGSFPQCLEGRIRPSSGVTVFGSFWFFLLLSVLWGNSRAPACFFQEDIVFKEEHWFQPVDGDPVFTSVDEKAVGLVCTVDNAVGSSIRACEWGLMGVVSDEDVFTIRQALGFKVLGPVIESL